MTTGIHWQSWTLSEESDRRFRLIVLAVGLPVLILSIIIPWLNFETQSKGGGAFDGTQYVQLIQEPGEIAPTAEQPKPAEKDEPTPPQKAAPVKQPTKPTEKPTAPVNPHPVESARDVAAKSGLMQFKNQLADLRTGTLDTNQPLTNNTISSKGGIGAAGGGSSSGENIASSAASGSGGIGGTGNAAVTSTQSGSGIGERRTATVKSNIGSGADRSKPGQNGDKLGEARTLSELQLVFQRNYGAFLAIFSREERESGALGAGKVVVSLTISPSGAVTECHIVNSSFNNPDLEAKIVARVKLLSFGPKNVAPYTYPNYPINYTGS
jgi:TonB family protein